MILKPKNIMWIFITVFILYIITVYINHLLFLFERFEYYKSTHTHLKEECVLVNDLFEIILSPLNIIDNFKHIEYDFIFMFKNCPNYFFYDEKEVEKYYL